MYIFWPKLAADASLCVCILLGQICKLYLVGISHKQLPYVINVEISRLFDLCRIHLVPKIGLVTAFFFFWQIIQLVCTSALFSFIPVNWIWLIQQVGKQSL